MKKQMQTNWFLLGRVRWIALSLICAMMLLAVSLVTGVALASSGDVAHNEMFPSQAIQSSSTPTPTLRVGTTATYSVSLATLGYDDARLASPNGRTQYSFRLPESWEIEADGILDLDFSYSYTQGDSENVPAWFGDLEVNLDGRVLESYAIREQSLDHQQLRVLLPESMMADPDQTRHTIGLALNAQVLCDTSHKAELVVHSSSSISLNHSQRSLVLDLARYPGPFYQRAFEPDSVYFVLPSKPAVSVAASALSLAAKMGDLTGNRMVISSTTDVDLSAFLSTSSQEFDEHLFVIGQPQDNQLLPLLNELVELPVSLHQRQMELVSEWPETVASGDTFSYAFTVTNTLDQSVELSLVSSLSFYTEFRDCTPECTADADSGIVTWSGIELESGEATSLSLTLQAADVLDNADLENTVTLIEAELGLINADTLTSAVVADSSDGGMSVSRTVEGDYFFGYDGRAVAEKDGIIQEVVSPWSEGRAILIVTGLSEEAVQNASRALSSEMRFPGVSGPVALVQDVLPLSVFSDTVSSSVEIPISDLLGAQDEVIWGGSVQQRTYVFDVPGWEMTDEAGIDLYYSHSQLLDFQNSGLTLFLNKEPVASVALDESNADNGYVHVSLADVNIQAGQNRLIVRVDLSPAGDSCASLESGQLWFRIKKNSRIFLAHSQDATLDLNLDYFPYPFHMNPALADLLFALPSTPTAAEWGIALRLAAALGDSASGMIIAPDVMMDSDPQQSLNLSDQHIIAIGRPTRNALIQYVNDQLPQPFYPDSDQIQQRLNGVEFRLPPGIDLGYIELMASPWNDRRAFLAITGTTDESLGWAADVLVDTPWAVNGNLSLVRGGEVDSIDTRELTSRGVEVALATAVPEASPATVTQTTEVVTSTPSVTMPLRPPSTPEAGSKATARPAWLIPLVGVNGLLVVVILAVAFWRAYRRRQ